MSKYAQPNQFARSESRSHARCRRARRIPNKCDSFPAFMSQIGRFRTDLRRVLLGPSLPTCSLPGPRSYLTQDLSVPCDATVNSPPAPQCLNQTHD
jgi:hypothetical protein